jgi:hypothetical protein
LRLFGCRSFFYSLGLLISTWLYIPLELQINLSRYEYYLSYRRQKTQPKGGVDKTMDQHQTDDQKPVSLRRLLVATATVPAAALALMMCCATKADATDISYSFTSSATITFSGIYVEHVAGTFLYNTVSQTASGTASLTGPGQFPHQFPTNASQNDLPETNHGDLFVAATSSNTQFLYIYFSSSLGGPTDSLDPGRRDSISSICCASLFVQRTAASGSVAATTTINVNLPAVNTTVQNPVKPFNIDYGSLDLTFTVGASSDPAVQDIAPQMSAAYR